MRSLWILVVTGIWSSWRGVDLPAQWQTILPNLPRLDAVPGHGGASALASLWKFEPSYKHIMVSGS